MASMPPSSTARDTGLVTSPMVTSPSRIQSSPSARMPVERKVRVGRVATSIMSAARQWASRSAWEALVGPLGVLEPEQPNLARFTFLDPRARATYPNWEAVADVQVSEPRGADLRWGRDALMAPLVT